MGQASRKRVRAKPEDRRAQILQEAIRLLGERGYFAFSVEELARRCQMSAPGLLHYFRGKDALLTAVLAERFQTNAAAILIATGVSEPQPGSGMLPLATVRKVLRAIVEQSSEHPEFVRLLTVLRVEAINPEHPAHAFFRAFDTRALAAYTQMLELHVEEPEATARSISALMQGLEAQWLLSGDFDLVAAWDVAVQRLLPES